MSVATVRLEWKGDPPAIYCPACGAGIYTLEDDSPDRCRHVLFTYVGDMAEFDYVGPACEAIVDEAEESAPEGDETEPLQRVLERLDSSSVVCLEITTHGLACGPASSTLHVAIDFAPREPASDGREAHCSLD